MLVPSKTPPPKQSKLEKIVPCLMLPSVPLNHLPSFKGINPRMMDMPPNNTIAKILLPVTSIVVVIEMLILECWGFNGLI